MMHLISKKQKQRSSDVLTSKLLLNHIVLNMENLEFKSSCAIQWWLQLYVDIYLMAELCG